MARYYFGVTVSRRDGRRIAVGVAAALAGLVAGTLVATRAAYVAGLVAVFAGLWYAQPALGRLFVPAPWRADRWRYAPLRHALDLEDADRWFDVGCGTGRSLVGLATAGGAPASTDERAPGGSAVEGGASLSGVEVTAVDRFDGRRRFGDGARRAERNAAAAGLDATVVRGDPERLPVREGARDVVTLCRAPGDREHTAGTVREARRVLATGGRLGLLAPAEAGDSDGPADRLEALLADGGFDVTASGTVGRGGTRYVYVVATPDTAANG